MLAVCEHLDELPDDLDVVVVTFAEPEALAGYRDHLGIAAPMVSDRARIYYRAYGLGTARLWKVWGPTALMSTLRAWRAGAGPLRLPSQDSRQLGGDVAIDRHGRVLEVFRPSSTHDRPSIDALAAAYEKRDGDQLER